MQGAREEGCRPGIGAARVPGRMGSQAEYSQLAKLRHSCCMHAGRTRRPTTAQALAAAGRAAGLSARGTTSCQITWRPALTTAASTCGLTTGGGCALGGLSRASVHARDMCMGSAMFVEIVQGSQG